jgi:hypothetical protein
MRRAEEDILCLKERPHEGSHFPIRTQAIDCTSNPAGGFVSSYPADVNLPISFLAQIALRNRSPSPIDMPARGRFFSFGRLGNFRWWRK